MVKMQNVLQGLVIFVLLTTLIVGIQKSFEDNYDTIDTYYGAVDGVDNGTISFQFTQLSSEINTGISTLTTGVQSLLAPKGISDLIGGLMLVAIGFIKTIWGLFTLPARILDIITFFYPFPPAIINFITIILILGFIFILLRIYTKEDL